MKIGPFDWGMGDLLGRVPRTINAYDSRVACAHHEAGHAVAAYVLGLGLNSAGIAPDHSDPGGVILGHTMLDARAGRVLNQLRETPPAQAVRGPAPARPRPPGRTGRRPAGAEAIPR